MIQQMLNIARREAERVMARRAMPKTGIVTAYDPDHYCAKVELQPEGVETGWLPIRTPWSGNEWGMFCPPTPGDEVEVGFQEGGKQAGYVKLRAFGDRLRPLSVPAGEFWVVHKSGSFLKFKNDGSVELHAAEDLNATVAGQANLAVTGKVVASATEFDLTGNVKVTGDITASGNIYDQNGAKDHIGHIRDVYDGHTHPAPGGTTNIPNQQL
ncbi:Phage-related baseplate assembly protein [Aquisphaera giovannonii]|uniref:Phage-related baseplate assembly protein n=1 Tax=Aquisphaera giovannonii TaxID=406548 RepID=A0A5B9W754_9BACT|nr:phage baseplate assembly protein V [Aquisphaera giovannonii]QEH36496.1 Phage-related baseplate assembly protein [Aquisphaera giovannonii]